MWSFCHFNKFLIGVNIPGNKAHSHSQSQAERYIGWPVQGTFKDFKSCVERSVFNKNNSASFSTSTSLKDYCFFFYSNVNVYSCMLRWLFLKTLF